MIAFLTLLIGLLIGLVTGGLGITITYIALADSNGRLDDFMDSLTGR